MTIRTYVNAKYYGLCKVTSCASAYVCDGRESTALRNVQVVDLNIDLTGFGGTLTRQSPESR